MSTRARPAQEEIDAREHGTYKTYQWERKHGLDPCASCRAAASAYQQGWRQRTGNPHGRKQSRRYNRAMAILRERHPTEFALIFLNMDIEEDE